MIACDDFGFAIQHIPKTGGTFLNSFFMKFFNAKTISHHLQYSHYENNHQYDLLICIRNPIDRIVSLYCDVCHYKNVSSFDSLSKKRSEYYSLDQNYFVPMKQEWIDEREEFLDRHCNGDCIEYFIENMPDEHLYYSNIIEDNIRTCQDLGKEFYILRQESLITELAIFLDHKNIMISKNVEDWMFHNTLRRSDPDNFIKAKKQLIKNKALMRKVLEKESFLSEIYKVVW